MKLTTGNKCNVAISILLFWGACPAIGQTGETQRRNLAKSVVRTQDKRNGFLRVRRDEAIEDLFCSLIRTKRSEYERDIYFFEVSREGAEFLGDGTIVHHVSAHESRPYFVAVAADTGNSYRVGGFRDTREEFNRL